MNVTYAQIKMLQTLRSQHGLPDDTYRSMLAEASKGRTTSTRELTQAEAFGLIDGLVRQSPNSGWKQRNHTMDKMRKKLIGYAREMGWVASPPAPLPGERGGAALKVDMERVNGWCKRYGFGKKPLSDYTYAELPKLLSQFETGPYAHYLRTLK